jgi:hypothetical protein
MIDAGISPWGSQPPIGARTKPTAQAVGRQKLKPQAAAEATESVHNPTARSLESAIRRRFRAKLKLKLQIISPHVFFPGAIFGMM